MKDSVSALDFKSNRPLMKRYLEINGIKGVFLFKESPGNWKVYEGTENYIGAPFCSFVFKRDAVAVMKEWCEVTGLPRFKDFK